MKNRGISIIELLVYLAVFVLITSVIIAFMFWLMKSNSRLRADREVFDSASRIMRMITLETKEAQAIYTPTYSSGQLSLKTGRYLGPNESSSYLDFFQCGTNVCLKREFSDPIILNSDKIEISGLNFEIILTNGIPTIQISFTAAYKNLGGRPELSSSVSLEFAATLRKP